jgi:type IV secretion system protein VirD4
MSNVHFVLDEAALLGKLDCVEDALGLGRAYAIRLQLYFQSIGQLKKCWPEGQEQTLLSNTSQIFFAVNDNATADFVSTHIGDETIIVDSGGTSRGDSSQRSSGPQGSASVGWSYTENQNWQQQGRKLVKPEEVIALPQRTAITFTPGVRPIATTLLRYYEEKWLCRSNRPRPLHRQIAFVRSLVSCIALLGFAVILTGALAHSLETRVSDPTSQGVDDVRYSPETVRWIDEGPGIRRLRRPRPEEPRLGYRR